VIDDVEHNTCDDRYVIPGWYLGFFGLRQLICMKLVGYSMGFSSAFGYEFGLIQTEAWEFGYSPVRHNFRSTRIVADQDSATQTF